MSSVNLSIVDISQVNMEELIIDVREEKVTRLLKQIIKNNVMLLNLKRQILKLQVAKDQKRRRQQEKEQKRKENEKRWKEE